MLADGVPGKAMMDSGSQVSTVAEWYYRKYLENSDLISVEELLDLRQVSGQQLEYIGIVAVDLQFPELQSEQTFSTPILVLKDTEFNTDIPFLIGTNVINACFQFLKQSTGSNFNRRLKLSTPWKLAFQYVLSRTKNSFEKKGKVCCSKSVLVPPSSDVTVSGLTRVTTGKTLVLTDTHSIDILPAGLVLLPSVQDVDFSTGSNHRMPVQIRNLTTRQITIPAKAVLCSLQEVSVVDPSEYSNSFSEKSFLSQFKIGKEFSPSELEQVKELLIKYKQIFSTGDTDLGRTNKVKHHIILTNSEPFREKYRGIPPQLYQEVKEHLRDMLKAKVIKESTSPFASPIVLVRKKDGKLRFCIDYRKLNSRTVRDALSLPRIDETLDSLVGAKFFSCLDLKSGYWQVQQAEEDQEKTAFTVGPLGFYEWETMPMGLVNSGATFQRLMQSTMGDIHLKECLLYLDDIIVFSSTFSEHLSRLSAVFQRLQDAGLKLKPSKCFILQEEVKYLGHVVSKEGIKTDPDKIQALKDWPVPTNVNDLRKFLGFASYFRRFVPGFSQIAKPLHSLLKNIPKKKSK